ncbi:MAG: FMN-binding glutamate synthase family protein [Halieaceae bacterium]|nr:FMN-binding glutamate synthase family protein [Halieaceae bacterium]MCP5147851.1 FMN-binding glutamate synthase family protein [Pseudomonadales bacterium]MCP5167684.1 FMN-binding glutamate synthase family protein [Pseudomonadales bacterium]MCP5187470.1 FMN-binding glutamate synthase family protein [Pseudomonadales bacterium]
MRILREFCKRYGLLSLVVLATCIAGVDVLRGSTGLMLFSVLAPIAALGLWDLLQHRHTLLRNYPLLGRIRWLFEYLRPYLRQYIVEGDLSGQPFNREQRSLVYERAKQTIDAKPFGTDLDVYGGQYELVTHSICPSVIEDQDFRVEVGNGQCDKPYYASLLNISAMSFGALGGKAIEALNRGAATGGFYHDTGEGGISKYHRLHGGDLVWEIGSGYFGCRDKRGGFDVARYADLAQMDQVKMVEIKLSQGAKPGHGGVLPGSKVTPEIARARGVPVGEDCVSPARHSAFTTPLELLEFAALLRERSGGKPVGIKLCVGHPWELFAICKAMLKSGIRLDFIVVDGAEGGTGAAPEEFSDHVGMALREGLVMTRNALVGTGLREHIRIAAAGKVYSAFSIMTNLALGADWCNSARSFMFALGCVMSKNCHTDRCPTGVATQDPGRQRGLVVADKYLRVANFHHNTLQRFAELLGATGLEKPHELLPHHLNHRLGPNAVTTMDRIKDFILPGQLLEEPQATSYASWWEVASAETFQRLPRSRPSAR